MMLTSLEISMLRLGIHARIGMLSTDTGYDHTKVIDGYMQLLKKLQTINVGKVKSVLVLDGRMITNE